MFSSESQPQASRSGPANEPKAAVSANSGRRFDLDQEVGERQDGHSEKCVRRRKSAPEKGPNLRQHDRQLVGRVVNDVGPKPHDVRRLRADSCEHGTKISERMASLGAKVVTADQHTRWIPRNLARQM
jgi:hypothetical protein